MSPLKNSRCDRAVLLDLRAARLPSAVSRLLAACEALAPGMRLTVLARTRPTDLLALLEQRGFEHRAHTLPDGCQVLQLHRGDGAAAADGP